MKNKSMGVFVVFLLLAVMGLNLDCSDKKEEDQQTSDIWDIDANGIPRFVETNYIELGKIGRISRFRSSVGHDYSDAFEHCRSMKHYFEPKASADWASVRIYSPVNGTITRAEQEWAGTKLEIVSSNYPAFRFSVFHINLSTPRQVNDILMAGEFLGTHIGSQTTSDISVLVNDPGRQ